MTTITYNPQGTHSINITDEIYIQGGEKSFEKVYGHKPGGERGNLSLEDFVEKELLDDPII